MLPIQPDHICSKQIRKTAAALTPNHNGLAKTVQPPLFEEIDIATSQVELRKRQHTSCAATADLF